MTDTQTIEAEVAILGAGPAGTAAAAHLGQLGVKDVVLCDKHDFPRDKTCGSGVSPKGIQVLRDLGVWEAIEREAYPIRGLRLVTRGDRESYVSGGQAAEAVVCLRRVLDHRLLERATSLGTRFVPDFTAVDVERSRGRICGFRARDGRVVRARYTFIAGGSHCRIGTAERPRRTIQAIMGWWDHVPFRAHHVEMIFDKMIDPYYGWLFPEGGDRVNIGITYEDPATGPKHNARALFQRFLDKHYGDRLRDAKQIGGWKGHPIVYSYEVADLTSPGALVLGEAGLMTHPATAEGIYQGMRSGMFAAESVADIVSGRSNETRAFARYEKRCKDAFRLSFVGGALFRRVIRTPLLDWIVAATDQPLVKSATAKILAHM